MIEEPNVLIGHSIKPYLFSIRSILTFSYRFLLFAIITSEISTFHAQSLGAIILFVSSDCFQLFPFRSPLSLDTLIADCNITIIMVICNVILTFLFRSRSVVQSYLLKH